MNIYKYKFLFLWCFLFFIAACSTTNSSSDTKLIKTYISSVLDLQRLDFLVYESEINSRKWIFDGKVENHPAKDRLKEIHEKDFPNLENKLNSYKTDWTNEEQLIFEGIIKDLETIKKIQTTIMTELASFEDYQDAGVYFDVIPLADEVKKNAINCRKKLNKLISIQEDKLKNSLIK